MQGRKCVCEWEGEREGWRKVEEGREGGERKQFSDALKQC